MALGINQVAALAGSFMGLLIGGLLADTNWRAVFLVSVPFGIFGTVWGYLKLREVGQRGQGRFDWAGNLTFGIGLIAVLVGITYGIQPYGGHTMGWTSPLVLTLLLGGAALLGLFLLIEHRSGDPLFHLDLFRIRAFSAGNLAGLLASISRGGLQFMLIIWLQGIWLPLHGYSFASTPLWAGIYMIPLTLGFLVAGPVSGWLSDHYGARPFATGGMLLTAASFAALMLLPIDFPYLGVRGPAAGQRHRLRAVRRAQHRRDHERRPGPPARGRLGHAGHLPERRVRAVHRAVLLADDRRPGRAAAHHPVQRPDGQRRARRTPPSGSPTCRRWAACSPPSWATTRSGRCSARRPWSA